MRHKLLGGFVFAAVFAAVTSTAMASRTWYTNGVSGSDSHNCLSPSTACKTIGHAISLATSGDTIRVAAATYKEHIEIPFSLSIAGSEASTTVIDGKGSALAEPLVATNAGATVTLSHLTIRNSAGRGILNAGKLIISNSTLTGNSAIALCRSTCVLAGGGIYNSGELIISDSTISGNGVGGRCPPICGAKGGGIYNAGTLTISDSTISENGAESCHFIICSGEGGGIYNTISATLTISSSTISGNSSPGPGGGILNDGGKAILQNSIVASNSENCSGISSDGYNLSDDDSCNFNGPGDMNNTDPLLGTLGNNGGPTKTIPLLAGSPAIDVGNPNGCTDGLGHLLKTDQRGFPRPDKEDGGGCDIGAYESQRD